MRIPACLTFRGLVWLPRALTALLLLLGVSSGPIPPAWGQTDSARVDADIVLENGWVHRGDGEPAQRGSVAIRGDQIVGVGAFETGTVGRRIDCSGLIIAPGFIDLHNHSDRQVLAPETRAVVNYLTQGCTTIVTGNCGSGPVDVGDYYRRIDELGAGVNVAHLLPQGGLRRQVVGNVRRAAEESEIAEMKRLAAKAMQDGAWGVSTGLIYVPSSYASTEELIAIAKVVGTHRGIYASHIRNENTKLLDAVEEALEIGRAAGTPVHISHFKSSGKNAWGLVRVAVDLIEKRQQKGARITADQYPYTASSTSLGATLIPSRFRSGGRADLASRLEDPESGPQIREAISKKLDETDDGHRIQIASYSPQPTWVGRRLDEIATDQSVTTLQLVLGILKSGGAGVVNHSINEDDVRFVMNRPWVATASDGSAKTPAPTAPHPRSYGTFPRKIGHYAQSLQAIDLATAIRSCSGLPADILGMPDRGYLKSGYKADVVVWDAEKLRDRATFASPHEYSEGMAYVFVNGRAAIHQSHVTGALAGRALRRPEKQR